jgi:fucose permease
MFLPSLFTGRVIKALGLMPTMICGFVIELAGCLLYFANDELATYMSK